MPTEKKNWRRVGKMQKLLNAWDMNAPTGEVNIKLMVAKRN